MVAAAIAFRDALLTQSPTLLAALLTRACTPDDTSRPTPEIEQTCLALLSFPLPANQPPPAMLATFLMQMVEKAVTHPSACTIRPLYRLISGVGGVTLEMLPDETITCLQDELIKLLRSLDDHSANLLCLAIFAQIFEAAQQRLAASQSPSAPDLTQPVEDPDKRRSTIYEPACQFFTAKRAAKTLDLVILRVVLSCSPASEMKSHQIRESFTLATEIINAVNARERDMWVVKNTNRVRKLYDKALRQESAIPVRLAVFDVLASLVGVASIPDNLITTLESALQQPTEDYDSSAILQRYAARFGESFILTQFSSMLRLRPNLQKDSLATLIDTTRLRGFLQALTIEANTPTVMRRLLAVTLMSTEFRALLEAFVRSQPTHATADLSHDRRDICPFGAEQQIYHLQHELSVLLLKFALYASAEGIAIDSSLAFLLLEKSQEACIDQPCNAYSPVGRVYSSRLPTFEFDSTPTMVVHGQDWKVALQEELAQDSALRYETIVGRVSEMCQDLEARCEVAEQPLREEQERSSRLGAELNALRANLAHLELDMEDEKLAINGLHAEKGQLITRIESAEQRLQDQSERQADLMQQLEQAKEEAAVAAEAATEQVNQQEFQNMATVTAKDEIIELLRVEMMAMEADTKAKEDQLSQIRVTNASLQRNWTECSRSLLETRDALHSRNEEAEENIQLKDRLCVEIEILKQGLADLQGQLAQAGRESDARIMQLELAATESREQYERSICDKSTELVQLREFHEQAIATLRSELDESRTSAAKMSKTQEGKIVELKTTIVLLQKERALRSKEFAEAQNLSSKLMAIMGSKSSIGVPAGESQGRETATGMPEERDVGTDYDTSLDFDLSSTRGSLLKKPKIKRNHGMPLKGPPLMELNCRDSNRRITGADFATSWESHDDDAAAPRDMNDGHLFVTQKLDDISFGKVGTLESTCYD